MRLMQAIVQGSSHFAPILRSPKPPKRGLRWCVAYAQCPLAAGCWLLSIGCCLLSVDWPLAIGYCPLAKGYCLLHIGYCILPVVYWISKRTLSLSLVILL
jgi:hypothetical protein